MLRSQGSEGREYGAVDPRLGSSQLFADPAVLDAQAQLSWVREFAALGHLGLKDGMAILELGSGTGAVSERLVEALPTSSVTAVDLDPVMCALAEQRLEHFIPARIQVLNESALNTSLPDESFDFVLARFLLQHLPVPELAIEEAHRLLKPGGILAVVDIDDALGGMVQPPLSSFTVVATRLREMQRQRGGHPDIGHKLWGLLRSAGFEGVRIETAVVHSDEIGLEPFLAHYHPDRFRPLLSLPDGLSQTEWETYRDDYQRITTSGVTYILHLLFIVGGRKPLD